VKNPKKQLDKLLGVRPRWAYSSGIGARGMTADEYVALSASQNDRCAICFKSRGARPFSIDHDHRTGRVRGLLCSTCNTGLGMFRDDVRILQYAIEYLIKHRP
jgi:hypothetical protein